MEELIKRMKAAAQHYEDFSRKTDTDFDRGFGRGIAYAVDVVEAQLKADADARLRDPRPLINPADLPAADPVAQADDAFDHLRLKHLVVSCSSCGNC
jgi:hypothetical protein